MYPHLFLRHTEFTLRFNIQQTHYHLNIIRRRRPSKLWGYICPHFSTTSKRYRVSPQTYWCLTVIHLVWLSLMAIQRPSVFTLWPEFQVGCSSGCYTLLFYLWMSSWKTANKALFRLQWEEIFVILCSILWLQGKGFGKCTYLLKGWTAKLRLLIRSPSSLKHICSSEHFTSSL